PPAAGQPPAATPGGRQDADRRMAEGRGPRGEEDRRGVPRQLSPAHPRPTWFAAGPARRPSRPAMPQTHTEQAPRPRSWPRRLLDGLYLSAGVAAAASMVIILLIILAQMACRALGIAFPGSTDYAGYFMAQTSFLAFAHALNRGAHIRVGVLLNALGRHRRWAEIW